MPAVAQAAAEDIATLCMNTLAGEGAEDRLLSDNCVSALGALVMNVVGDEFPVNESVVSVLEHMPATEDNEREYVMEFYDWLLAHSEEKFQNEFAAVLVRFFSEPMDSYEGSGVSNETLQKFLPKLSEMLQARGDEVQEFCMSVLGDEGKCANLMAFLSSE